MDIDLLMLLIGSVIVWCAPRDRDDSSPTQSRLVEHTGLDRGQGRAEQHYRRGRMAVLTPLLPLCSFRAPRRPRPSRR